MSSKNKITTTADEARPTLVPKLRFPEFRGAEGWKPSVLAAACEMQAGKFVSASNIYERNQDGLFPCYGGNGLRGYTVTRTHDGTYPLIGRQGALCGNVRLVSGQFHATEHAVVTTPKTAIDVGWLYYTLDLLNLNRFATGQAQPGLSVDVLENVSLAIPPLELEQQKIAECLNSVDELIAAQARKVDALKTHKKGLMQQLFPREGETQPRLRFPEFQNAGGWVVSELGRVSDVRDGTHDSPSFFPTGLPLVTSKNLRPDGVLDLENVSLISEEDYEQINKRSKVTAGDILFGMIGTIGNPVLIKSEGFAIKNVALIKEVGSLSNAFLVQLLKSEYVAAIFAVLNTGNSQKFIALGKIRGLPVPIPSLSEQQRIASCLSSLDDLITAESQKLEALKTHKKGLMQQLFPSPEEVEA